MTPDIDRSSTWELYGVWNNAIADHVYSETQGDRPVYLQLDEDILASVASEIGCAGNPADELKAAVRPTLVLTDPGHLFDGHVQALRAWRLEGKEHSRPPPPPCIALLAVFVSAAENMHASGRFGQNNYYDRLLEKLRLPASVRSVVAGQFRTHSLDFWSALDEWLKACGGRRGRSTARQVGGHKYVGVPISQALVRLNDRRRLKQFFQEYGYSPGDAPKRSRLERQLHNWIRQTGLGPSKALREIWDAGQHEAIIDIVLGELSSWDGSGYREEAHAGQIPKKAIRVAIQLRRKRLAKEPQMLFLVPEPKILKPHDRYPLKPEDGQETPGTQQVHESYWMERVRIPGYYSLEPSREFANETGLESELRLRQPDLEVVYRRSPRSVVLLRYEAATGLYVESKQIDSEADYWILVSEDLAQPATQLVGYLTAGQAESVSGPWGDVPRGWIAFRQVRFSRTEVPPAYNDARLAELVPNPRHHFAVAGGLPMPGSNTWHVLRPPEIAGVVENAEASLELWAEVTWDLGDAGLGDRLLDAFTGDGYVRLSDLSPTLAEGDFRIRLLEKEDHGIATSIDSTPMRLRSAVHPVSIDQPSTHALVRPIEPNAGLKLITLARAHEGGSEGPCVVGARYFASPDSAKEAHLAMPAARSNSAGPAEVSTSAGDEIRALVSNPYDLLLDALSYARCGGWPTFVRIAGRIGQSGTFQFRASEALASLGHVEIGLDPGTFKPADWCVAPPTICVAAGGDYAFLAGYRSSALVASIREVTKEVGGRINFAQQQGGPSVVTITGVTHEDLALVSEVVSEQLGIHVSVEKGMPERVLRSLPPLRSLIQHLPETPLPDPGVLDTFSVQQRKWVASGGLVRPGAYRYEGHHRLYGVATSREVGREVLRVADRITAENLAFVVANRTLLSHEPMRGRIISYSGRALPSIVEKALVLCSGRLPAYEARQRIYRGVPPPIAHLAVDRVNAAILEEA